MGYQATIIVNNDCLQDVRDDSEFGRKVAQAVGKLSLPVEYRGGRGSEVPIHTGGSTGAYAIETHHADHYVVLAVGNLGAVTLSPAAHPIKRNAEDSKEVALLRAAADQLGYTLRKKPAKKTI